MRLYPENGAFNVGYGMSWVLDQVRNEILQNRYAIGSLLNSGRTYVAYEEMSRISSQVGARFGVQVLLNFPDKREIFDLKSVAMKGVSIIVDVSVKQFRRCTEDQVRQHLLKQIPNATISPARFGHEGFHADFELGRFTVLPSGVHVWCEVDSRVREFLDWLFPSAYGISVPHQ